MANLTVTVDGETLRRARIRALERGESVNGYLAEMLRRYAGDVPQAEIFTDTLSVVRASGAGADNGPRSWSRDELHRA
ncbi:hypothetical protein ACF3NS_06065 [Arsenicicoccus cauae]|uniref:Toxin-antitoxin system HicB family antitoxin n=1 Tax=Arsenicicoccus cauae TaxID=2663847 RepID=A0A6I3ILD5_9MICO|nr:hypothetical protein [Arsenicicoccus cauae]MTB72505.1 hypothetical protein [Arsenicicoccus cauae]